MLVTPDAIEGAYEFLRRLKPFRSWKLPPPEEIEFHVVKIRKLHGDYSYPPHTIRASQHDGLHLNTFLQTIAHESIHMKCVLDGLPVDHGKAFRKLAAQVCKEFGWDFNTF
jgi:hypothetical protein